MLKNDQTRQLAARVWDLAHGDPVIAVKILAELTGLSFATAFAAIEDVMPSDEEHP
jgi:hypothetical protein